jgi:nucleoid-associated protein YgaU
VGSALLAWQWWPGEATAGTEPPHDEDAMMLASNVERSSLQPLDARADQRPVARLGDGARRKVESASRSRADARNQAPSSKLVEMGAPSRTDEHRTMPETKPRASSSPPAPKRATVKTPPAPAVPTPTASLAQPSSSAESPARSEGERPDAPSASERTARARLQTGLELLARNDLVRGREVLSQVLLSGRLGPSDERMLRERLATLNERVVFSPEIIPGDPYVTSYTIEAGDALVKLPRKLGVHTDWRFIQRINRISSPERIRAGQKLKVMTGPFHAVINKHDYRMDIYLGDEADPVYVRSFDVGLGEFNSTPEGRFRVRENSRLINPEWVNPRTRDRYLPDDPANPIGEYWIGLEPDEARLASLEGYGIHGTIERESIGRQASMGCVRMLPEDVELVYELLLEGVSRIEIRK